MAAASAVMFTDASLNLGEQKIGYELKKERKEEEDSQRGTKEKQEKKASYHQNTVINLVVFDKTA